MDFELLGFPVAKIAVTPTPFEGVPRFSERLGGPSIFLKRDDHTGLALGGNKARKLELLMGEALAQGADTVITCGGPQSNHARMTAAAARKLGLKPILVLDGEDPGVRQGNLLLDHLLGAELVFSGERSSGELLEEVASTVRARGGNPYVVPLGGSNALGALAYMNCAEEIVNQSRAAGVSLKALYVPAGSVGTLAGIILGKVLFGAPFSVTGFAASPGAEAKVDRTLHLMTEAIKLLKSRAVPSVVERAVRPEYRDAFQRLINLDAEDLKHLVKIDDSQVGPGYGVPTEAGVEAIMLLARTEGVLTDPVYTAKALAGLVKDIRSGMYATSDSVAFVHTGGVPADFAFSDVLTR